MYAILQTDFGKNKDDLYLNHSCMYTMSFGSKDMAWVTNDKEKADLMCDKCWNEGNRVYGAYSEFEVVDLLESM